MKTVSQMTARERKNAAAIEKLNDCVNNEDYDSMDELFAADYEDHNPGWKVEGVQQLKEMIAGGHRNFDLNNELKWLIPSDDMVFVEVCNKGRHKAQVFGCPATGKETNMTTFEIYRFDEQGKICERWVVSDIIGFMKQVGATLPAGV